MSTPVRRARVKALAKLNLSLQVLHRRPDGFHELRTVFQTISLADTLELEYRAGRERSVSITADVEIPGENLVARAARVLMESVKGRGEVRIHLRKRIPMGGGLGGGSSDAAAVLLALPALAGWKAPLQALIEAGSALGSDVPFFLLGGTAVALGRGTELYPVDDLPARHGLVVAPGVHVSTAEAYRALGRELTSGAPENIISSFESFVWRLSSGLSEGPPAGGNDFEAAVFRDHPLLARIRRQLAKLGANPARMSGSGSALYGLFESKAAADRARQVLAGQVFPVRLVRRASYRSLWWRQLQEHIAEKTWPPRSRYAA